MQNGKAEGEAAGTPEPKSLIQPPAPVLPLAVPMLAQQAESNKALTDLDERMSNFEEAQLRWTRLTVGVSLLAAVFICGQWWEMHSGSRDTRALADAAAMQARNIAELATIMQKQSQDTHNLAVAGGDQAISSRDLAVAAKSQASETHDLALASKSQADASKEIANNARLQSGAAKDLATDAEGQLHVMQNQLEADRPRMRVNDLIPQQFVWHDEEAANALQTASFTFQVMTDNVGRSTAFNVQVFTELYFVLPSTNFDPGAETGKFCGEMEKHQFETMGLGNETTPNDDPDEYPFTRRRSPESADLVPLPGTDQVRVVPVVIGCINYRGQADHSFHQTRFVYELGSDGSENLLAPFIVGDKASVPKIVARRLTNFDYAY